MKRYDVLTTVWVTVEANNMKEVPKFVEALLTQELGDLRLDDHKLFVKKVKCDNVVKEPNEKIRT